MYCGLRLTRNCAVEGVLRYLPVSPAPSRCSNPSATRVSRKSYVPRGCSPIASCSSRPVLGPSASRENSSSSTALNKVLDVQNPQPTALCGLEKFRHASEPPPEGCRPADAACEQDHRILHLRKFTTFSTLAPPFANAACSLSNLYVTLRE